MKILLALGLLITVCQAGLLSNVVNQALHALKLKANAAKATCLLESGAPQDIVTVVRDLLPVTTRAGLCFEACLIEQYDVMDENNVIDVEKTVQYMIPVIGNDPQVIQAATEVVQTCSANYQMDRCEFAHNVIACLLSSPVTAGLSVLL
ncbi:general odorant-binding protein 28a-like [Condylostylus longicornis]|uniref:general odorant-binding protein 28a-like n=1 Tax=Condylostylus longicornis TaxID=2530218 RepID=UPI00244DE689|nr:general odorant-binding protein 28a-like [Condylostylus longicornis]